MLVDDNANDNFFHERVINRSHTADLVVAKQTGEAALEYLKATMANQKLHPELILLDINMPGMNGWEFLEAYEKLAAAQKSKAIVVMLTTSENPDDQKKTKAMNIATSFKTKPLTTEMLQEIMAIHFKPTT